MKCEFIDECPYAKEYIGRVCLYKAEICNTRSKIAQNKELEKIFSEEGYTKDRITIKALKALGKPEFLTIIIRWRNGKTTFLSVREVREKVWERSTFPSHIKELLDRIHDKFVSARRFGVDAYQTR